MRADAALTVRTRAAAGSVWAGLDWQAGIVYGSGSITYDLSLSCIPRFPSKVAKLAPSVSLTVSIGFERVTGRYCNVGGFSRGVHFASGVASINAGNWALGFAGSVQGKILLGLVCSDDQGQSSPARVGVSLLVTGELRIAGVTTPQAYYLEPSSAGVCGQRQTGSILPDGTGFDASDGLSYNLIDSGVGRCF